MFFTNKSKDIYGSSEFLSAGEKKKILNKHNKGLVLDGINRLSEELSFRHLLLVAPTGAGKTSTYIMPNLLSINSESSVVITDPSGEIFNKTSGYLSSKGYKIKVVNVSDLKSSLKFNPLYRANSHTEIKKISEILVNTAFSANGGDQKFWNDGAKNIINILIRCLKKCDNLYYNLHNLRHLLNSFGKDGTKINDFIAKLTVDDLATFNEYKGFISNDEKVVQGMIATAKTSLDKFSDPGLCELTCEESLNFESMREEKTIIYIIVPEHEVKYYGFFLSLLYTQIFDFCMKLPEENKKYLPIYFLLDEFGNMSSIPSFSNLITTLRKRKCSCSLVLQDIEQLNNIYGKSDASTIVNGGCTSKIFLPGLSLATCEEVERILGKKTILYSEGGTHAIGTDANNVRDMRTGRSLLTSDEIRTMKDNQAIFIHGNKKPILLKTKPYYKNKPLIKKTKTISIETKANTTPSLLSYMEI
jgi:type IV secretory pathway TraG/TraD family ATPase VirD4